MERVDDMIKSESNLHCFIILVGFFEILKLAYKPVHLITKPLELINIVWLQSHRCTPRAQYRLWPRRHFSAHTHDRPGRRNERRLIFVTVEWMDL